MQRAKFSLAGALWLLAASTAMAQTNDVPQLTPGTVSLEDDFSGTASLGRGGYIDVRNMTGSGVGYQNGYTQIGGFLPLWGADDWFIAPQARLIVTDNQKIGANVGVVARRYKSEWDRIIGANLYYDTDESLLDKRYNQIGFGFETLGQWWDARANVYLPTNGDYNNLGPAGIGNDLRYSQNRLVVNGFDLVEQSMKGADFEVGVPVLATTPWLRAFVGAYFYDGTEDNPVGVRARVDANISNDLLVGVNVTNDSTWGTNVNAVVDFRFSGFLPTRFFPQWTTEERMLTQVQRNWRIATSTYFEDHDINVINPRDDQPYFVVHVDSSNANPGDGTAENPYQNLPAGVPADTDLVLVQRGNSTQAAPYTGNIQLVDYARMLGEGKAHVFDGYATYGSFTSTFNNTVLPGFSNSGLYPFLSNPAGDIVTLANHNEVSAFVMQDASGRAIYGNGTSGFHLNNLEIAGNLGGGIVLQNAVGTGPVTVDGQTIDGGLITDINRNSVGGYTPLAAGVGNNGPGGILIDTGAAGLEVGIARVTMNGVAPGAQDIGVGLTADDGNLAAALTDVRARGNDVAGVNLTQTGATTLNATLTTVDVAANAGDGLQISGNAGTTNVVATGLLADDNLQRGVEIQGAAGATMDVAITASSVERSGVDNLAVLGAGVGTEIDVLVSETSLVDGGQTTVGASNVFVTSNTGAETTLILTDTPAGFTGANDDNGMTIRADSNGIANVGVLNGSFSNAGVNGIDVRTTTGGTANVGLDNTSGNNAGSYGFFARSDNGLIDLDFENGSNFNLAGISGLYGESVNGGTLNACIEGSTFNSAQTNAGIQLIAAGVGSTTTVNLDTVAANQNSLSGLNGLANGGELNIRVIDSTFNQNGVDAPSSGVVISAINSGTARTLFSETSANNNTGNGFEFLSNTNATMTTRLDSITATGNDGFGVSVDATGNSSNFLITEGTNNVSGNTLGSYDLNYNTVTNAVVALTGSFNNSTGDGVNIAMNNVADTALVSLTGNGFDTISNNAGNGVNISINGADQAGVVISGYAGISNNGDDGINIDLTNITTASAIDLIGVTTPNGTILANNGLEGIDINLTNAALGTITTPPSFATVSVLSLTSNDPNDGCLPLPVTISLNGIAPQSDGITIQDMNVSSTSVITDPTISGISITGTGVTGSGEIVVIESSVTDSVGAGITVDLTGSTVDLIAIGDNTVSGSQDGNGITVALDGTTVTTGLNVSENLLTDNNGDGFGLLMDNAAVLSSTQIALNEITGNNDSGIRFDILGSSNFGSALIALNSISGQLTGDGFTMINPVETTGMTLQFQNNEIVDNLAGRGVNVQVAGTNLVRMSFLNDGITGNGQEGVFLGLGGDATGDVDVVSSATANPLTGLQNVNISDNGGRGIGIDMTGTSDLTLDVGGTGTLNTFDANGDAGIGVLMNGDNIGLGAVATINIDRSSFTNTINASNPDFEGDGFKTILRGRGDLTGTVTGSTFTGNASNGIELNTTGNNSGVFAVIHDFTIGGAAVADGNLIQGNGSDGLSMQRTADGQIANMLVQNNTINANLGGNGVYILSANANKQDSYTFLENSITNNGLDGVLIDERADSLVRVDMDLNTITGNAGNGIHLIEQVNSAGDLRELSGTWTRNDISDNGQNGILLSGVTDNLTIGSELNSALGNLIEGNDASGINITGAGNLLIGNNLITQNGTLADLGTAAEDAGIMMDVAPVSNIRIVANDIVFNNGDGIQYGQSTAFNGGFNTIEISGDNIISNNAGRGIDLINRQNTWTRATITDNTINSNGLEGVYIINTASGTQNQFAASNVDLAADGSVFNTPILQLLFSGNEVRANGINSPSTTTGFWLRVGTSDGGGGTGDTGGFASAGGFTTNPLSLLLPQRGGVIASMFDNTFGGNFGDDIKYSSFVSTVNPVTSAGTWGDTTNPTEVTAYQSDPLARLDLYFDNNTYESENFLNTDGVAQANPSTVAFYNNAEATFKSRTTGTGTAPLFNGPFTSATRRRNAQRQAAVVNNPVGTSFLYPGMGESTFRVNTTDPNFGGSVLWGGAIFGEEPYEWGTLP